MRLPLIRFRRPDEDVEAWLRDFACVYADEGKTGLFEAKRIAALAHPHLFMLPPAHAARFAAATPHALAPVLGKEDVDARGQPRVGEQTPKGPQQP